MRGRWRAAPVRTREGSSRFQPRWARASPPATRPPAPRPTTADEKPNVRAVTWCRSRESSSPPRWRRRRAPKEAARPWPAGAWRLFGKKKNRLSTSRRLSKLLLGHSAASLRQQRLRGSPRRWFPDFYNARHHLLSSPRRAARIIAGPRHTARRPLCVQVGPVTLRPAEPGSPGSTAAGASSRPTPSRRGPSRRADRGPRRGRARCP